MSIRTSYKFSMVLDEWKRLRSLEVVRTYLSTHDHFVRLNTELIHAKTKTSQYYKDLKRQWRIYKKQISFYETIQPVLDFIEADKKLEELDEQAEREFSRGYEDTDEDF